MPTNPYCPPNLPAPGGGRIISYLAEALSVSPADLRGVGIALQASLSSTTPGTDSYRVPADQDLIVLGLQGYVTFPTLQTEPTAILTFLNLDPSERIFVKAQNCLARLENVDRSLGVFDARDIPLASVTPPVGAPMYFPLEMPYVVPATHTLRATFTLQDSTAAIVGNASGYGLLLTGTLIPHDLLKNIKR